MKRLFAGTACVALLGIGLFLLWRIRARVEPGEEVTPWGGQAETPAREMQSEVISTSVVRYVAGSEAWREHPAPVALPAPSAPPQPRTKALVEKIVNGSNSVPGEWILRFKDREAMQEFLGSDGPHRGRVADVLLSLNSVRIVDMSAEEVSRLERETPGAFEYSPNLRVEQPRAPGKWSVTPDSGVPGAGFGPQTLAWLGIAGDHRKWGEGVSIAVLDVGVGSCPSLEGAGVVRVDMTGETQSGARTANSHGTAVAAILSGGIPGREGVAPSAQLISVKVLGDNGSGDSFTLAKGIEEATARGARIINLCLGSRGDCPLVRQAVERAIAAGAIVVAAVGNDSTDGVSYPARYEGVIGVTAVDASGKRLAFANSGPEVDIAAPGLDVWAAASADTAMRMSGTSAAVPLVSGVLAYLISGNPGLTAAEVTDVLLRNSNDAGMPGRDREYGCGILNAGRILDRGTSGIHDAAIADNCIDAASAGDGQLTLVVSVQNRGTEALQGADLRVMIGEFSNAVRLTDIGVGETAGCRFLVRLPGDGPTNVLRVASDVSISGATDDNPLNNARTTVFTISGPAGQR